MAFQNLISPITRGDGKIEFSVGNDAGVVTVRRKASGANPAGAPLVLGTFTAAPPDGGGDSETPGSTPAEIATAYHTLTERAAPELAPLITFANALETAGIFDKIVTLQILSGGTELAAKINFVHPADNPGALPAVFNGTVTFEPDGVLFDANSGFVDSGVNYARVPGAPNLGVSWYTKDLFEGSIIANGSDVVLYPFDADGSAYNYLGGDMNGAGVPVAGGNKRGFKTVQRVGDLVQLFHSDAKVAEKNDPVQTTLNNDNTIKLHYSYGSAPDNQTGSFSMYSFHRDFTPTEQAAFFDATETLMAAFGINVIP